MSSYFFRSQREYTEKDGRLTFRLRGINASKELRKVHPGKWVKFLLKGDSLCKINGGSGVYVISIRNKNKEDICYIGSSKSIPVRLYSHKIISFLSLYLSLACVIEIHILYTENIRTIENKLISSFLPFLNSRVPEARIFNIRKKQF
jgi:hypothetical protein